jgi:hypothetical protein
VEYSTYNNKYWQQFYLGVHFTRVSRSPHGFAFAWIDNTYLQYLSTCTHYKPPGKVGFDLLAFFPREKASLKVTTDEFRSSVLSAYLINNAFL